MFCPAVGSARIWLSLTKDPRRRRAPTFAFMPISQSRRNTDDARLTPQYRRSARPCRPCVARQLIPWPLKKLQLPTSYQIPLSSHRSSWHSHRPRAVDTWPPMGKPRSKTNTSGTLYTAPHAKGLFADCCRSYESLPPNFSLAANMAAGAFAGIAVCQHQPTARSGLHLLIRGPGTLSHVPN